jgi:prepilin-type N-terminal cleavage/methylation domain-containing protein
MIKQKHNNRGYTLLEIMVSVGLFTIVMVIAMGAYVTLIGLDRKTRATNDVTSNLSFVVESIARSIRTGTEYMCGGGPVGVADCIGGSSTFSFTNDQGSRITYRLKANPNPPYNNTVGMCDTNPACPDVQATTLTDPRIAITTLTFYVKGSSVGDNTQPQVLFTLKGTIQPDSDPNSPPITFTIESSATQRLIDI